MDVERDAEMTRLALNAFEELVRRFPKSNYARDGQLKIDLTKSHLAGKEMTVGRFYLKREQYVAALRRFDIVVKNYDTSNQVPEALYRKAEAYLALGLVDQSERVYQVAKYNYPESIWTERLSDLRENPEKTSGFRRSEAISRFNHRYFQLTMLHRLTVSNIVLIEHLTLEFGQGLTVLTGETGAGKSILLDALGLALGSRANFNLIRQDHDQASVSASFVLPANHPAWHLVEDAGIMPEDEMILRRRLKVDGKSTASINDIPVSIGLLRKVGDLLIEIQGQFEGRGLLDASTHRTILDHAAGHYELLAKTKQGWQEWDAARTEVEAAEQALDTAKADEDWLRDALDALDQLAPKAGEEEILSGQRTMLANISKIGEGLSLAEDAIFSEMGAQATLGRAVTALEKVAPLAAGQLDEALESLLRADAELNEAGSAISASGHTLEAQPDQLQRLDDRLHELRQQARKHGCSTDELPFIHQGLADRLAAIEDSSGSLGQLREVASKMARLLS